MSKKRQHVTINISPFDMEIQEVDFQGLTMVFFGYIGDDYTRRKYIRIRLTWWWIPLIVTGLKKAHTKIADEFAEIAERSWE